MDLLLIMDFSKLDNDGDHASNRTDMEQFKQNNLDRLLSIFINYMYYCDNPTPIDKIYHYTKEEFPDYSEDELGKIIVASSLFSVFEDRFYSISAHDTVRDLLSAKSTVTHNQRPITLRKIRSCPAY